MILQFTEKGYQLLLKALDLYIKFLERKGRDEEALETAILYNECRDQGKHQQDRWSAQHVAEMRGDKWVIFLYIETTYDKFAIPVSYPINETQTEYANALAEKRQQQILAGTKHTSQYRGAKNTS